MHALWKKMVYLEQQIEQIKIVTEELNTALEEKAPIREVIKNVQTRYEEEYLN
ncbi:hypothetical protein [Neochlamydia sp. S13]|uniref:hypothetical protein n=1 Tax=Neochlamydia sp. S13 TaxID=1353976 RepID=UPI00131554C5|nr:hypothetical protein [Neochlamydia sp. S13]